MRRKWLDESSYASAVALCQALPGPANRQAGMVVGTTRASLVVLLSAAAGVLTVWLA